MTQLVESQLIPMNLLQPNTGQIEGLPKNPRIIKDDKFKKLQNSIKENPEMLALRELLVYPQDGKYIIIGGNQRYEAMKSLKYKDAPCKVLPVETSAEQLQAYTIKDNNGFGEWDYDLLANEWDSAKLDEWGTDVWQDVQEAELEEPKDLDDNDREPKDYRVQIVFANENDISRFIAKYKDVISEEFDVSMCINGGGL